MTIKAGDTVLVVRHYGDEIDEALVHRVTPTRHICVKKGEVDWGRYHFVNPMGCYVQWKKGLATRFRIYENTPENMEKLIQQRDQKRADDQQKKMDREKKAAEDLARQQAERAEVQRRWKELYGETPIYQSSELLPDGSRLYVLNLPVNPNSAERKKGYEVLLVRCTDATRYDYESNEDVPVVEWAMTYINGRTSSFSCVSTQQSKTDEDALWEAAVHCYFGW